MTLDEARAVLGVNEGATREELKSKYREAAGRAHPDHGGSAEEFLKVKEAFDLASQHVRQVPCGACMGAGSRTFGTGFSALRVPCSICGGSGIAKES